MARKNSFNAEEALVQYSHLYNRMCYDLLSEQLFQSLGLELSAASIYFECDNTFVLKGRTFAYFNPIDRTIHVNIQDPFFTVCTNDLERRTKLLFILFHEMYHKVLLHDTRCGKRDHNLFNIAADFEVHNMLYLYKECCSKGSVFINEFNIIEAMLKKCDNKNYKPEPDSGEYAFMFAKDYLNKVAEEIYNDLMNSKQTKQETFKLDLSKFMSNNNQQQDQQNNNNGQSNENNSTDETDENSEDQAGKNKNNKNQSDANNDDAESQAASKKNNNSKSNSGNNKKKSNQVNKNNNSDGSDEDDRNQVNGKSTGQSSGNTTSGGTVTVTTTTYELPNGRKITSTNIEWPDMDQLDKQYQKSKDEQKKDAENAALRRQVMEQNLRNEVERNKGNVSSSCQAFLKKLFKVKIDWEKILKNSLQTVLTKSDYFSWARPRKTTMAMDMPYLPDIIDDTGAYGKVFICVDQSGSMSDDEFTKIGNIILAAKDNYKKIVVIQHDSEINHVFEFDEINDDTLKNVFSRTSCGGTSHMPVYQYIAKDWADTRFDDENKISAVIVCSDCCSDIQDAQKQLAAEIPMIYLVPEHCNEYTKGIRGQVIQVA